jgi:RNA polymerase sigma-70 factor (ECF subfamily)
MVERPEPADAELVLAVVAHDDREAFARLVRRHQSLVRSTLRRLAKGDHGLADDLAQETFLLAWRNLRSFRFDARFSTWLYRIAFNAWLTDARRRREVPMDDAGTLPVAEEPAPAVSTADRLDLERALLVLSDGERAAIAACYYADLTHEEAAEAMGIPLGTVTTHILRAKAKLRAKLGEEPR